MFALGAPEESYLALISCTELAEPPDSKVVFALGTFNLDCGHGLHLFLFVINNPDLPLLAHGLVFHIVSLFNFPDITTFPAFQLAPGRY